MKASGKTKRTADSNRAGAAWKGPASPPDSRLEQAGSVYQSYIKHVRACHGRRAAPPDIPLDLESSHSGRLGFRRNEVSLVASRPGAGKTAFLISAIDCLITSGKFNMAVFLPDMPPAKFCAMLTAVRAGVEYDEYAKGYIPKAKRGAVKKAGEEISGANLWISTKTSFAPQAVYDSALALASKLKKENKKLDIAFIDSFNYLAECGDPTGPKGWAFDTLTALAKATDSAVVCSYDLGKDKEDASFKTHPKLRDFRVRGVSEDAVGLIINIVRPEFYGIETSQKNEVLCTQWNNYSQPASKTVCG